MNPNGTSDRSCHQPLRFVSCNRLAPTASKGSSVTTPNKQYTLTDMSDVMALPSMANKKNHQYSGRPARPSKSAYFAKHVFVASTNGVDILKPRNQRIYGFEKQRILAQPRQHAQL